MSITLLDGDFAKQKLLSAIALLETLLAGDWPYDDSSEAIRLIKSELDEELRNLSDLDDDSDPAIRTARCQQARSVIQKNMGYVGFILRSSNVRNSFEIYYPIKTLANEIFGGNYRVIVGSEWNYSPFVYPMLSQLLDRFILVGLPANEAQNALLVPTAGHELGHAIWRDTPINNTFSTLIRTEIVNCYRSKWPAVKHLFSPSLNPDNIDTNLEARSVWTPSYTLSARQLEEVFCDCVGVWLFGESYLHSFRYLLAPDSMARPSDYYPPNRCRAEFFLKAASEYGDSVDDEYPHVFRQVEVNREPKLEIADLVTEALVPNIISEVATFFRNKSVSRPVASEKKRCEQSLRSLRPVPGSNCIADVLNAAWSIRISLPAWSVPGVEDKRKIDILNDLVFKSFEVMEWSGLRRSPGITS